MSNSTDKLNCLRQFYFNKGKCLTFTKRLSEKSKRYGFRRYHRDLNGDHYRGEWRKDKKWGKGMLFSKTTGKFYEGDFANDMKNGYGILGKVGKTGRREIIYDGFFKNNLPLGEGIYFAPDGAIYEGQMLKGKRYGFGKIYFSDHTLYAGEWLNDEPQGIGLQVLENGDIYKGEWFKGKRHGRGVMHSFKTGLSQAGVWVSGVCTTSYVTMLPVPINTSVKPEIPKIELANWENLYNKWEEEALTRVTYEKTNL